mgnify:CR=1 FL=1
MIAILLASFKSLGGAARLFVFAGILTSLLAAAWTTYDKIWTAGYNEAIIKIQTDNAKTVEGAVKRAQEQWEASAAAAATQLQAEDKISRGLRDVEKEIPVVVETVAPGCRNLGPGILGMYNDAINAANNPAAKRSNAP